MTKLKNKPKTSIIKKITIYYAIILVVMYIIICSIFFLSSNIKFKSAAKDNLINAVESEFTDIISYNNTIEILNSFDLYYRGATLMIYSDNGVKIKGTAPEDFPVSTTLKSGEFQEIRSDDDRWIIYDLYKTYENGHGIWIRGIYTIDGEIKALNAFVKIFVFGFPIFILIATLSGYYISKKALNPLRKITETADKISSGRDLSMRLPKTEKKDEIYCLTNTLNLMFNRLETAFNTEKQFTSDVSHELKTPVSVMLAECEYALKNADNIAEYKESVSAIQQQCKRMMSLIQQLLQMSRTINIADTLEIEEFNLSLLCDGLTEEFKLLAEQENTELRSIIEPDIVVKADETLILRMLVNLFTNAIKYRKTNVDNSFVQLDLKSVNNNVIFTVTDNGTGIKEEDIPNIFNRFFKADKARSMNDSSFGLGLSMVKWIAEAHGGNVSCKSMIGEGSIFTVTIKKDFLEK